MRVEAVAKRDRNKNITEERRLKAKAEKQEFLTKYFFKPSNNSSEEVHALRVDNDNTIHRHLSWWQPRDWQEWQEDYGENRGWTYITYSKEEAFYFNREKPNTECYQAEEIAK